MVFTAQAILGIVVIAAVSSVCMLFLVIYTTQLVEKLYNSIRK